MQPYLVASDFGSQLYYVKQKNETRSHRSADKVIFIPVVIVKCLQVHGKCAVQCSADSGPPVCITGSLHGLEVLTSEIAFQLTELFQIEIDAVIYADQFTCYIGTWTSRLTEYPPEGGVQIMTACSFIGHW